MKKLIVILAILLSSSAYAGVQDMHKAVIARMNASVASCDTEANNETGLVFNTLNIFKYRAYVGTRFTSDSDYTVCKIGVYIYRTATAASNDITACIYTDDPGTPDNASNPNTVVSCSTARAQSTLGTSVSEELFTNVSATLTTGTYYWVVIFSDGLDITNYVKYTTANDASVELIMVDKDGVGTWTYISEEYSIRYKLYE